MFGASRAKEDTNEDSILIYSPGLMGVFDGVGGERGGAEASRTARQWLWNYLLNLNKRNTIIDRLVSTGISETEAVDALWRGLSEVNDQIFRGEGLGTTTATVGMICRRDRDILVVAHVGDSRAYILRQGKLFPITIDDQPFLDRLKEAKARQIQSLLGKFSRKEEVPDQLWPYFEQRHKITKAVGAQQVNYSSSFPKIYKVPLQPGDRVLLCTDGLSDNLTDWEIREILNNNKKNEQAIDKLIKKARERMFSEHFRAKPDDVSVILMTYKRHKK